MALQFRRPLLLAIAVVALFAPALDAQEWTLDASAGHATYDGIRTRADGANALLSLGYRGGSGFWGYVAGGSPIDGFSLPWLALGAGTRAATTGRISAGTDAAAHGYLYTDRTEGFDGSGGILHFLPFAGIATERTRLELYTGMLHHEARGEVADSARTAHDSGLRLRLFPLDRLAVSAEGRLLRLEGESHPYVGTTVSYTVGVARAWVSAGRWFGDDGQSSAGGVGATLQLRPGLGVHASYQQEARDPMYGNVPRRSWSVGITQRLGRPSRGGGPAGVRNRNGRVTLLVPISESPDGLAVAGEFNGWSPIEMTAAGRYWSVELELGSGIHRYAFRRPDGTWFVPPEWHRRIDDGMGGDSAILVVP